VTFSAALAHGRVNIAMAQNINFSMYFMICQTPYRVVFIPDLFGLNALYSGNVLPAAIPRRK
jgi:hypothetical protein